MRFSVIRIRVMYTGNMRCIPVGQCNRQADCFKLYNSVKKKKTCVFFNRQIFLVCRCSVECKCRHFLFFTEVDQLVARKGVQRNGVILATRALAEPAEEEVLVWCDLGVWRRSAVRGWASGARVLGWKALLLGTAARKVSLLHYYWFHVDTILNVISQARSRSAAYNKKF